MVFCSVAVPFSTRPLPFGTTHAVPSRFHRGTTPRCTKRTSVPVCLLEPSRAPRFLISSFRTQRLHPDGVLSDCPLTE